MKSQIILAVAALTLSGCVAMPIAGSMSDGQTLIGEVHSGPDNMTDFVVRTAGGLECRSLYQHRLYAISETAPLTCNDGRKGNALIARQSATDARKQTEHAELNLYFADMNVIQVSYETNEFERINQMLESKHSVE